MDFDERLAYASARGIARDDLPGRPPSFERRLALAGNYNFRDAGGYPVRDGRVIRRDVIFRSDHLAGLTDDDVATVAALRLRRVHDFRLAAERERQPSRLPAGHDAPKVVLLGTAEFSSLDESTIDVIRDILAGTRPLPEPDFWEGNYLDMVQTSQRMLVGYLRSIAQPDALPALHHCTGGKDRTGVSTALLHRILGVSDSDIMDDFLLTNLYRTPYRVDDLREGFTARDVSVTDALPILGVSRKPLEGVLAYWDANGGARAYALDGGATEPELNRISDAVLTPSD